MSPGDPVTTRSGWGMPFDERYDDGYRYYGHVVKGDGFSVATAFNGEEWEEEVSQLDRDRCRALVTLVRAAVEGREPKYLTRDDLFGIEAFGKHLLKSHGEAWQKR